MASEDSKLDGLQILLIVLAILGVGSIFFGLPHPANINNEKENTSNQVITKTCDVFYVQSPKNSDKYKKVTNSINLVANFTPCEAVFSDYFSFVVVDSKGKLITSSTPLLIGNPDRRPISINQYIPIEITPNTGEAYIIITRFNQNGNQVAGGGQRIPVNFVN